ncbi:exodeoxyribonuclease VII large subunit [Saccharicrinis aurantiacus]|uniref:exodeoxyribonuclease VII large subunit n=1 Tax=Saccharicrinis aurantiacus TaxID=1849719 RepID=UPI0024920F3A|nr:exodeoxyribonuclease VII large subunit [Saccharicrinis aurantiacus]
MSDAPLSLFELNNNVKKAIHTQFDDTYWVVAEISEIREVRNGHCYLELIEKEKGSEQIIAKTRANIWAYTYRMLKPYFESSTGQTLSSGIKVMIRASIDYQEVYGLSLNVRDIDPNYTLGDMAQKRQAIIKQLTEEGVIDMNKDIELPMVVQKIAIISSPSAAGYEDFMNQLNSNKAGIKFYTKLFPAIMQGDQTEESVAAALEKIYEHEGFFDAVAIIRGGGSSSDLMAFDNYWIAYNIAQFPLPVFSGIGHERDESIVDLVAHTHLKTPTAVAEFIIELATEFNNDLSEYKNQLIYSTEQIITELKNQHNNNSARLKPLVKNAILSQESRLQNLSHILKSETSRFIQNESAFLNKSKLNIDYSSQNIINQHRLKLQQVKPRLNTRVHHFINQEKSNLNIFNKTNELLNPTNILRKGYSISYANGKVIKNKQDVKEGDTITTHLFADKIESKVTKK